MLISQKYHARCTDHRRARFENKNFLYVVAHDSVIPTIEWPDSTCDTLASVSPTIYHDTVWKVAEGSDINKCIKPAPN